MTSTLALWTGLTGFVVIVLLAYFTGRTDGQTAEMKRRRMENVQ